MQIHQSLGYLLNTSARWIKRTLDLQLKEHEITTSQWALLKLLSVQNDLTQAEIADKLSSDRATTGTVIDKLIDKKLVTKSLSPSDRRSYRVTITDKALEMIEIITTKALNCNSIALQGLTDNETLILAKCLETIISNLSGGVIDVVEV